jgi:gas vesicle protein
MKKIITLALAVVFASSLTFAQRSSMSKEDRENMKAKREEMKKDREEMQDLIEKYNKEKNAKKKSAIEAEVKAKVAGNYDKHLERMAERVKDSEKRLEEAKKRLEDGKKPENKEKHVNEITKKILSGEKPTLFSPPNGEKGPHGKDLKDKKRDMKNRKDISALRKEGKRK